MKHHYIPKFLLKQWASRNNGDDAETLEAFRVDLEHVPSSRLAPAATAREKDLYALSDPVLGFDPQIVETGFLQRIDASAAPVLERMLTKGFDGITHEQRCSWVWFIMSLCARTPEAIFVLDIQGPHHLQASLIERPEEYLAIFDPTDPRTLVEYTDKHLPGLMENFGKLSLDKVICNPRVGDKILNMKWWLCDFSKQRSHLVLADRPCIFTTGIDDLNLVIALPISPQRAFLATKTNRVSNLIRQLNPRALLMKINESSIGQARQRVYALDESPRRFICNSLAKLGTSGDRR